MRRVVEVVSMSIIAMDADTKTSSPVRGAGSRAKSTRSTRPTETRTRDFLAVLYPMYETCSV